MRRGGERKGREGEDESVQRERLVERGCEERVERESNRGEGLGRGWK